MKTLVVIPARMGSSRFHGKPLAKILDIPMLKRVWAITGTSKLADKVVIATDSGELKAFAEGFGAEVVMTRPDCKTGLDRVAEAAGLVKEDYEVVMSFQGDAVLTPPWIIDDVLRVMQSDKSLQIATPIVELRDKTLHEFIDFKKTGTSTGTTVTFDKNDFALYFSKNVIPSSRSLNDLKLFRHIGMYAYRKQTLQKLAGMEQGYFEVIEQLEQLRALENGIPIKVVKVDYRGRTHCSIDNPEDVKIAEEIIKKEGELI